MRKSYSKYETFKLIMKDGTFKTYWCEKKDLLSWISVRDYRNADHIEIWNKGNDSVKHRPIKLEALDNI